MPPDIATSLICSSYSSPSWILLTAVLTWVLVSPGTYRLARLLIVWSALRRKSRSGRLKQLLEAGLWSSDR